MNEISLETTDKELFNGLLSAKIEGVTVDREIKKSLDPDIQSVLIQLTISAVPTFAVWLLDKIVKTKAQKTTINERPVPNQVNNIVILIKQELKINTPTPDDKK